MILKGDDSVGEFYSVAVTNNHQQADTGTKMIHIGKNTRSTIVSKGISAGHGQNTYRGMVKILEGRRRRAQLLAVRLDADRRSKCGAHTFPYIDVQNPTAQMEHEASTSKIGEDQLFYCNQRGISTEDAVSMIVNGFCKEVFRELPMEFAVEAQKLLGSEPGRKRRMSAPNLIEIKIMALLEIKNLHASVEGNEILKGSRLSIDAGEVHAIMGPNGSGKSTLAQVLAGREDYEVTEGEVLYKGQDLLELAPEERARAGRLPRLPVPGRDPGVSNTYFLKAALNAIRKHRGQQELDAVEFLKLVREKVKLVELDDVADEPPGQRGLLGRREEAQRDLPHGGARAHARGARRDRLRARHRRAQDRRRRRQHAALAGARVPGDHPLPAPAQLHRARPRARPGRRTHRALRRQGARARARGEGLRWRWRRRRRPPVRPARWA